MNPGRETDGVDHGHSLRERIPDYETFSLPRRAFVRCLGMLFGAELAAQIVGVRGPVTALFSAGQGEGVPAEHGDSPNSKPTIESEDVERLLENLAPSSERMSAEERDRLLVDYAGVALFVHGITTLIRGKNINASHYALLTLLTKYKFDLSDDEGKHHLREETIASVKALGIIAGTIIGAEGMNADLVAAYEQEKGRKPSMRDRVALLSMLSACISPVATTVGSATILKNVSTDLCKLEGQFDATGEQMYDKRMMAICTSHISNLSGFVLFGDPPFIAMVEKYGFRAAVEWQMKAAFPLLMYSMFSSTYKLNRVLAERSGLRGREASAQAVGDTVRGLMDNAPFLCTFLLRSLRNAASYVCMGKQDIRGIEIWVGEKLMDTLRNIARLPWSEEFDVPDQPRKGLVHGPGVERVLQEQDSMLRLIEEIVRNEGRDGGARSGTLPQEFVPDNEALHRLREAMEQRDYDAFAMVCAELHIAPGVVRGVIARLRDVQDNAQLDDSVARQQEKKTWRDRANIFRNVFSTDRQQSALGYNLADVVNVFPFQAGCVPFLLTAFRHAQEGIAACIRALGMDSEQGTGRILMEVAMYFLIEHFSCVADNYVACKVGLEIFPDRPQLALIAAIQGGSKTAIGNMANVAQFDLRKFGLAASLGQWRQHLDTDLVALAYTLAIGEFQKFGMLTAPAAQQGLSSHVSPSAGHVAL